MWVSFAIHLRNIVTDSAKKDKKKFIALDFLNACFFLT